MSFKRLVSKCFFFIISKGFKEEIDGLQEELDVVQNQGAELMTACGEPDKPVIKKSVDEVIDKVQSYMQNFHLVIL